MARIMLTRRSFFSAAALAGLGTLTGCSDASVSETEPGREDVTIYDQASGGGEAVEPAPSPVELEVLVVGDVLLHDTVQDTGLMPDGTRDYAHLFAQVADDIAAADVAVASQESPLGGASLGLSGYPAFNGPQEVGDAEVAAGFDVITHANNHALDRGMDGIAAELAYWRSAHPEVLVTGIADTQEASDVPPVIERGGHVVAVLSYATMTNGIPLPEPWAVRMMDEETIAADVAAAREAGAEFVVACPHWGEEYVTAPDDNQRHWAQVLADAGVDVIVGGHPHVLQPFEVLAASDGRSVPVFWSLGNFTSNQNDMETMVGGMARVRASLADGGASVTECRLTALVTHKAAGTDFTTYRLADYTEELAAANDVHVTEGNFSRQACVDFCAGLLGDGFDSATCDFVWQA